MALTSKMSIIRVYSDLRFKDPYDNMGNCLSTFFEDASCFQYAMFYIIIACSYETLLYEPGLRMSKNISAGWAESSLKHM